MYRWFISYFCCEELIFISSFQPWVSLPQRPSKSHLKVTHQFFQDETFSLIDLLTAKDQNTLLCIEPGTKWNLEFLWSYMNDEEGARWVSFVLNSEDKVICTLEALSLSLIFNENAKLVCIPCILQAWQKFCAVLKINEQKQFQLLFSSSRQ